MGLILFLFGIICGLLLNMFLRTRSLKRQEWGEEFWATKEDINKIIKNIKEIENTYKNDYDILKAEKEFYDENKIE